MNVYGVGFGHGVWWNGQEGGEEVNDHGWRYALMMSRSGIVICHKGTSIMCVE